MYLLNAMLENIGKKTEISEIHIVYAGLTYCNQSSMDPLGPVVDFLVYFMQKNGLDSVLATMLVMERVNLVTKEVMKVYYKGNRVENKKIGDELYTDMYASSINDDFEEFFHTIKLEAYFDDDGNSTFFLPKITKEELRCVFESISITEYRGVTH